MAELDLPRRVIRKGSLSDIPKFNPVEELLKAGRYAKFGHAENTSGNSYYQLTQNAKLDRCLSVLNGEMSTAQVSHALQSSTSAAYKWLVKLGELGFVDSRRTRIGNATVILFSRIND
jgi:hypothetical protein